jgi:peroxiredoxin
LESGVVVQRRFSIQRWLISVTVVGVLTLCASHAASAADRALHHPLIGSAAPDFAERLINGTGRNFRLSEQRGDVVLLGFWTSWCGSCRAYLERLAKLNATYASAGLVVVGISLDDKTEAAVDIVRALGLRFANVADTQKVLGRRFAVSDVPLVLLVDRSGIVRFGHGELDAVADAALVAELRRLLDE